MCWKLVLVSLVVLAIIVLVVLYSMGVSLGFDIQGFQNLSGPAPAMNTFTMYYADWCPHCKSVKPEFNEFSNRGSIEVGGKKCQIMMVDAGKNPDATKGKPVKGFPTFLLETG